MESVTVSAGKLTRFFNFGTNQQPVNYFTGATTGVSQSMYAEGVWKTFQASSWLIAGTAVTATVNIQGTNDPKTGEYVGATATTLGAGVRFAVAETATTTLTSGALFGGYYDSYRNLWVPPGMVGDPISGPGIPVGVTVTAIASTSSLTISSAATLSGSFDVFIGGQLWSMTTAVTLTPAGTPFGVADATLVSAHRWIRANLSALTSVVTFVQVELVY